MGVEIVGFLGLGAMGSGLASNLQRFLKDQGADSNFYGKLHVWNRSLAKAAPLQELGASLKPSAADLARVCNICFAMLFDDAALEATFSDFMKTAPTGTVFVNCATVDPALSSRLAELGKARDCAFMSAPVFGRPDAAAAKKCLVVASGPPAAMARVRPLLEAMGRGVVELGDDPATAAAAKLVGNFMIISQVEILAEALNLGDRSGVPREGVVTIVEQLFPGAIIPGYAKRIAADAFSMEPEPGFPVTGGLKDARLMLALGQRCGAALPTAKLACEHMEAVEGEGMGGLDWGALSLAVRKEAP